MMSQVVELANSTFKIATHRLAAEEWLVVFVLTEHVGQVGEVNVGEEGIPSARLPAGSLVLGMRRVSAAKRTGRPSSNQRASPKYVVSFC